MLIEDLLDSVFLVEIRKVTDDRTLYRAVNPASAIETGSEKTEQQLIIMQLHLSFLYCIT